MWIVNRDTPDEFADIGVRWHKLIDSVVENRADDGADLVGEEDGAVEVGLGDGFFLVLDDPAFPAGEAFTLLVVEAGLYSSEGLAVYKQRVVRFTGLEGKFNDCDAPSGGKIE